eukprot:11222246-Lingulodinium_polyedra.AAC.1
MGSPLLRARPREINPRPSSATGVKSTSQTMGLLPSPSLRANRAPAARSNRCRCHACRRGPCPCCPWPP